MGLTWTKGKEILKETLSAEIRGLDCKVPSNGSQYHWFHLSVYQLTK